MIFMFRFRSPAGSSVKDTNIAYNSFSFSALANQTGLAESNIVSIAPPVYTVEGVSWNDMNRDGLRQSGEPLLWNTAVRLMRVETDAMGRETLSVALDRNGNPCVARTDTNGTYSFTLDQKGTFRVQMVTPEGYYSTVYNENPNDGNHLKHRVDETTLQSDAFTLNVVTPGEKVNGGAYPVRSIEAIKSFSNPGYDTFRYPEKIVYVLLQNGVEYDRIVMNGVKDTVAGTTLLNGEVVDQIQTAPGREGSGELAPKTDPAKVGTSWDRIWTYRWQNLPAYDVQGKPHTYRVVEFAPDGFQLVEVPTSGVENPVGSGNYQWSFDNGYREVFTAYKQFKDGKPAGGYPAVYFQLVQKVALKVDATPLPTTDSAIRRTSSAGDIDLPETYYSADIGPVVELDGRADGRASFVITGHDSGVDSNGVAQGPQNITVEYAESAVTSSEGYYKMAWYGLPTQMKWTKAAVNYADPVSGETFTIQTGDTVRLKYDVREVVNAAGSWTAGAPDGYVLDAVSSASTLAVNVKNKVSYTAKKAWQNGDAANRPAVSLTLYREYTDPVSGDFVTGETVPGAASANLKGTEVPAWSYTWENLPRFLTDANGIVQRDASGKMVEYTYYAQEDTAPANYQAIDKRTRAANDTITNTYVIPKINVEATKNWVLPTGYENIDLPGIKFELWRKNGKAGTGTYVTEQEVLQNVPAPGADPNAQPIYKADFGLQDKTDIDGVAYEYYVKEKFVNASDVLNRNWIIDESGLTVSNTLRSPADATGSLTIGKALDNELSANYVPEATAALSPDEIAELEAVDPLVFTFLVSGPYDYSKEVKLKAGETTTLENLHFGTYTVEEIADQGYEPVYKNDVQQVTLTDAAGDFEKQIDITNVHAAENDPHRISVTVEKTWLNGPKPEVTVELWRKGLNLDGSAINEKMDSFTATVEVPRHTTTDLAKHDPTGRPYVYYAVEPTVPENYIKTESGLTVTNEYVIPKIDESGTKTWVGDNEVVRPTLIVVELLRDGVSLNPAVTQEVVADESGIWAYTFSDLDQTDLDGIPYTYSVSEVVPEDYAMEATGMNLTNTYIGTTELTIDKVWLDDENAEQTRPSTITFEAVQFLDGQETGWRLPKTFELNENSLYVIDGLPEIHADSGMFFTYELAEEVPEGYQSTIDQTTGLVINRLGQTTTVDFTKTWVNAPNDHPGITVALTATVKGQPIEVKDVDGNAVAPIQLTSSQTAGSFDNLPSHDDKGQRIVYKVVETHIGDLAVVNNKAGHYEVEYDGNNIRNTYKPPVQSIARTGEGSFAPIAGAMCLLLLGGMLVLARIRRRRKNG